MKQVGYTGDLGESAAHAKFEGLPFDFVDSQAKLVVAGEMSSTKQQVVPYPHAQFGNARFGPHTMAGMVCLRGRAANIQLQG